MSKNTVQMVADERGKLVLRQKMLITRMRLGDIGRRSAYEELKKIRADINQLVGRLGSM